MSTLVDSLAVVLCLGALAALLARSTAATISVAHRRPWLRRSDLERL